MLLLQFAFNLFGMDHGGTDAHGHWDGHDDGGVFFGVLSVRTLSSALASFGMAGMAALTGGLGSTLSVLIGAAVGFAVMIMVVTILRSMRKLSHSGTIDIGRAVDQIATVYVPIPANYAGQGKVTLDVMQRTLELAAVTHGPALATGTRVRVVQLVDGNTAEVVSAGFTKGG